jgi:hypothetical protein
MEANQFRDLGQKHRGRRRLRLRFVGLPGQPTLIWDERTVVRALEHYATTRTSWLSTITGRMG